MFLAPKLFLNFKVLLVLELLKMLARIFYMERVRQPKYGCCHHLLLWQVLRVTDPKRVAIKQKDARNLVHSPVKGIPYGLTITSM